MARPWVEVKAPQGRFRLVDELVAEVEDVHGVPSTGRLGNADLALIEDGMDVDGFPQIMLFTPRKTITLALCASFTFAP